MVLVTPYIRRTLGNTIKSISIHKEKQINNLFLSIVEFVKIVLSLQVMTSRIG